MPMTEAEWTACADPLVMLHFLRGKASDRKMRLFACACVARIRPLLTSPLGEVALKVSERFADGLATVEELQGTAVVAFGPQRRVRFGRKLERHPLDLDILARTASRSANSAR
jgi:hypothetical protein